MFGPTIACAWAGQTDPRFRPAFLLVCLSSLFGALSVLALVLYRVSGKALLDNIRQLLRIALIVGVVALAPRLGFVGILAGLAACELAGMLFMLYALARTFDVFRANIVMPDAFRLSVAAASIFTTGLIASYVPLRGGYTGRTLAAITLAKAGLACLLVSWPVLVGTGAVTASERQALLTSLFPKMIRAKG